MINLLPEQERQKLFLDRRRKLTIIFVGIVLAFLICLILILTAIKFYILSEVDSQKGTLAQVQQQNQSQEFKDLSNTIKRYDAILAQLDVFYKKELYFNQALKTITGVPGATGIHLANFALSRDKKGNVQVGVSGVSDTRDNLLDYKKNIELTQQIKNLVFAPESWISPQNANFSLTFNIMQNEKQK